MKMKSTVLCCLLMIGLACGANQGPSAPNASNTEQASRPAVGFGQANASASGQNEENETPPAGGERPRSVRDFFMLLPEKYFVLEGCERATDKDCRQAKLDYLRTFAE